MDAYSYSTARGPLEMIITGVDEPNNGRMLNRVKLLLDGQDVTSHWFGSWNYIVFNLRKYDLVSADKKWIYIPGEDHFLINAGTLEKTGLPDLYVSAVSFIGNAFYNDFLIVLGRYDIVIRNLQTHQTLHTHNSDRDIRFEEAAIVAGSMLQISYSDGHTLWIDLPAMRHLDSYLQSPTTPPARLVLISNRSA